MSLCFCHRETSINQNHNANFQFNSNGFHEQKTRPFHHTVTSYEKQFTQTEDRPYRHNQETEVSYNL